LTGGRRTALPRHQTLRATLDWSYELLGEPERVILRRLAVFAGVFRLEATSAVIASPEIAPAEVVEGIANLVAKSLVTLVAGGTVARYRLLDTIWPLHAHRRRHLDPATAGTPTIASLGLSPVSG
jgi:predicted ATPase